jgi:8-oxo-dGTP pyrophosphatase MutT (NUDIX family)
MEPIKQKKRPVASYLPYRKLGDTYEFYLQMRSAGAKTNPGLFGLFGGGIEADETAEEALMREIMEELRFTPREFQYFSRYETANSVLDLFIEEAQQDLESNVEVHEGDYGKFISYPELQKLTAVSHLARQMTKDVMQFLSKE